jgi:hypothetical protein
MVTLSVSAGAVASRPKLVVGVMVDGLSMAQIELLRSSFGPDGFNRLLRDGVSIGDVDYGTPLESAAAAAVVFTGASPSINGIDSPMRWDRDKRLAVPVFNDPAFKGVYTSQTLSPKRLLVSTIADELRIDGSSAVHSIAIDAPTAIIMAGHAGNSAAWINTADGNWSSTSFYGDIPAAIQARNFTTPLSSRIDSMAWVPSAPAGAYPDVAAPAGKKKQLFRLTFSKNDPDRYRRLTLTPLVNSEVTTLATDYISSIALGRHDKPDMLNLAYTVAIDGGTSADDARACQLDTYLRLDRDLARLIRAIDAGPGMDHTLLFIAGTPAQGRGRRDDERWGIPYGEFSRRRAVSLLNMYLIARYGNGDWVNGFSDGRFYLNHTLARQRGNDLARMRADAAAFLAQMEGVVSAVTIDDITSGRTMALNEAMRRNVALAHAGDIYIELAPGWEINEENEGNPATRLVKRAATSTAPFFLMAPDVAARRVDTPVDAREIAPTVAGILRIRSPNGAAMPAIDLR